LKINLSGQKKRNEIYFFQQCEGSDVAYTLCNTWDCEEGKTRQVKPILITTGNSKLDDNFGGNEKLNICSSGLPLNDIY
jgi:hypothetical protein